MFLVGCGQWPRAPLATTAADSCRHSYHVETIRLLWHVPHYRFTVSADGGVIFEGRESVKVKGVTKGTISLEKVRQLIAQFDSAKYFSLNDKYETEKDGCPEVWTDNPSVVTSIRIKLKNRNPFLTTTVVRKAAVRPSTRRVSPIWRIKLMKSSAPNDGSNKLCPTHTTRWTRAAAARFLT